MHMLMSSAFRGGRRHGCRVDDAMGTPEQCIQTSFALPNTALGLVRPIEPGQKPRKPWTARFRVLTLTLNPT